MVRANTTENVRGRRSRAKRRAPSGSSDPFVDEVDHAEGWMEIIEIFCRQLALPGASSLYFHLTSLDTNTRHDGRFFDKARRQEDFDDI